MDELDMCIVFRQPDEIDVMSGNVCVCVCVEMNLMSKLNKYKVYATNQVGGSVNLT